MYIHRIAESRFQEILDKTGKVGIILGARQVGKSTLVKHSTVGRKTLELNFDVEIDKSRFLSAASLSPENAFLSLGKPDILILDEAQRIPECSRIVKGWIDKGLNVKILLLGSSNLSILDQTAESLTGRNYKLSLPPLTFEEIIKSRDWYVHGLSNNIFIEQYSKPIFSTLLESMVFGGYPETVTSTDKINLLRELSSDYLWKDLLQCGLVKTPELIRRLLMLLAYQAGSEVSTNELASQLQMARQTIERYIDLLEQSFVIFKLSAFSTNARKEIVKGKKIFFWDTGIRNALLGDFTMSDIRPDIGSLWENWVISEAAKWNLLTGNNFELFFWRSRAQSEVDLILKKGTSISAYEIKWKTRHKSYRAFRDAYGVEPVIITSDNPFIGNLFENHI